MEVLDSIPLALIRFGAWAPSARAISTVVSSRFSSASRLCRLRSRQLWHRQQRHGL